MFKGIMTLQVRMQLRLRFDLSPVALHTQSTQLKSPPVSLSLFPQDCRGTCIPCHIPASFPRTCTAQTYRRCNGEYITFRDALFPRVIPADV